MGQHDLTLTLRTHFSQLSSVIMKNLRYPSRVGGGNASALVRASSWNPAAHHLSRLPTFRYNSTTATATPTDAIPVIADNSAQSIDALLASDLAAVDLSQIPEKIGYLKSLGL